VPYSSAQAEFFKPTHEKNAGAVPSTTNAIESVRLYALVPWGLCRRHGEISWLFQGPWI